MSTDSARLDVILSGQVVGTVEVASWASVGYVDYVEMDQNGRLHESFSAHAPAVRATLERIVQAFCACYVLGMKVN